MLKAFEEISSTEKRRFNQSRISEINTFISTNSLKDETLTRLRSIFANFFKSFKRFNSFTFDKPLSNNFCFLCLRNFFCWRRRFNLNNLMRVNSFVKRFCSRAAFHAVSISNFSRFNFVIVRSITSKLTNEIASSHFLLDRTHSEHFRKKKNKRHCFCFATQRIQTIITTTRQKKSIRFARIWLTSVLRKSMMNLRNEEFEKKKWCYDSSFIR